MFEFVRRHAWIVFLCIVIVLANCGQNISIPIWLDAFGPHFGGPYFVVVFASLCFTIIFTISYLLMRFVLWPDIRSAVPYAPSFREHWRTLVLIGLLDAVNGFLVVYASPPNRTPPIIQPMLGNTAILWSIIFSKLHIDRQKSYLNCWVVAAIFCILASMPLIIVPQFLNGGNFGSLSGIAWIIVFVIGVGFGSWYNVLQQKALHKMRSAHPKDIETIPLNVDVRDQLTPTELYYRRVDKTFVLMIGCAFQLAFMIILWPLNILPWFGTGGIDKFASGFSSSISCYFNQESDCGNVWWLGLIFIASYAISYVASLEVNETSANMNEIATTLVAPLGVIFWYIWPNVVSEPMSVPPLWSLISALVLLTLGVCVWRYWEHRVDEKSILL
jgi:hypothetical protein